jgi:DNA-binding SARP family transcriptional activator
LSTSAQRLVALVALRGGGITRKRAAFTLWPDATEARAYGSLRTALFRLRAVCPGASVLESRSELELSATVGVDVRRAYELATRLETAGSLNGDTQELERLLDGGDLLPDWYDDWVLIERERFHELRVRALETLSELHLASREVASAIRCSSEAVRADPLRESSRRLVISALLVEGNRAEALAHHRQFRELLQPLGLVPSPRFDELAHDLVAR